MFRPRRLVGPFASLFKRDFRRIGWLGVLFFMPNTSFAATATILHSFNGYGGIAAPGDGAFPNGGVILQDGILYGTASNLGMGGGSLFRLNSDGSNFALLHKFNGLDGSSPGAVTIVDSKLYGTTSAGGSNSTGTLFSASLDGSAFSTLYSFNAVSLPASGPAVPSYSLTSSDGMLYGTSLYGGDFGSYLTGGTVFKSSTDGDVSVLHSFGGAGILNPNQPRAGVVIDNDVLYGTTYTGGQLGNGVVFRSNLDGTDFQVLHSFGIGNDGANPSDDLVVVGSKIYGTTQGVSALVSGGQLFSMNLDGTGFELLHIFAPTSVHDPLNGNTPGTIQFYNGELYGTTAGGGEFGHGTLYRIGLDGNGYELIHSFSGGLLDGDLPNGPLAFSGSTIFGSTTYGGTSGFGTIYAVTVPEPCSMLLASLGLFALGVSRAKSILRHVGR